MNGSTMSSANDTYDTSMNTTGVSGYRPEHYDEHGNRLYNKVMTFDMSRYTERIGAKGEKEECTFKPKLLT